MTLSAPPPLAPAATLLACGEGWSLADVHCQAGPGDRAFEECHDGFSIAAVAEGSFVYHGEAGRAVLLPGSLLLGNQGACYQCGHDHSRGDRCVSLSVSGELFGEVAASQSGSGRYRFPASAAVATGALLPAFLRLQSFASMAQAGCDDGTVLTLLESVLAPVSAVTPRRQLLSARDVNRARDAAALIEAQCATPLDLASLASAAGMSRYHFLRVFRAVMGVTPHQYILTARLRRAAEALAATDAPVTQIAYASGFGDLSTFNGRFRAAFGTTPSGWRARH